MFNWVVKVVPQPPEAGGPDDAADASTAAAAKPQKNRDVKSPPLTNIEEGSDDSQGQTGVLGWLSNGFVSALPQPSGSPRLSRANSEARQPGEDGEKSGVIGWVAQGLTKVLPQPDDKYKETDIVNNDEHTEVYDVETMPDYDPLPHIPVVEMVSEDEASEVESLPPQFPPNVVNWIKQMIPQPVTLPPGAVPPELSSKSSRSSLDKILSPPPESLSGISLDTDSKTSGVVGWFVTGLGLKMPQPAVPQKDDAQGAAEVLQKVSSKLKPDMVLEDVESDNEGQQKCESHPRAASLSTSMTPPASPAAVQQQTQSTSPEPQKSNDVEAEPKPPEDATQMCQEDAETQTGRWTPFIESIKREAEDVALATMEERLLQERVEMARMAEEVARQTAEMAIRQMTSEGQSIKLSLGSQELLEEPEAELPPEEESQMEISKVSEKEESVAQEEPEAEIEEPAVQDPEPNEEEAEPQPASPSPPPSPEPVKNPEPEAETETVQEAGPEAVTQQPQKTEDGQTANSEKPAAAAAAEKEEEAAGDGCGAPVSCDALKSCLMRIPHTSECFDNLNAFFKENGISPPAIPSMPKLPTKLSDVTKYLPSLPPELRQELSQIRLTQVPRNIAQTVTELLPKNPDGSVGPDLSSLSRSFSESFSNVPQKLSQFPSRTQQYFGNVRNRLNSLMPQDA